MYQVIVFWVLCKPSFHTYIYKFIRCILSFVNVIMFDITHDIHESLSIAVHNQVLVIILWNISFNWPCPELTWPEDMNLMNIQTPIANLFWFVVRLLDISLWSISEFIPFIFDYASIENWTKRWANLVLLHYLLR